MSACPRSEQQLSPNSPALAYRAEALAEASRLNEAQDELQRCREMIRDTCLDYYEPELMVLEAFVAREEGSEQRCHALLAEAFALAIRINALWRDGRLSGRILAAMCAEALQARIEPEYLRALIRRFQLEPPPCSGEHWPWPIRIRTLGGFELFVDDQLVTFSGKAPKKPLTVLKALIALGPQPVPLQRLADELWPTAEGDAANHALSVALLSLRKLLGVHDAVVVREERASLNSSKCWIDSMALESAMNNTDSEPLLRIYRGNFLPADIDQPWTAPRRERLRAAFIRHAIASGQILEESNRWDAALEHYLRGIAADDLAESLYQGAMRCYLRLRRPAEGIALYRRLKQMLSVVLGVNPAHSSEAIAASLRTASIVP